MNPAYPLFVSWVQGNYKKSKKLSFVDYGCGTGLLLEYLPNRLISRYRGFDINKNSISVAKSKYKNSPNISFATIDNKYKFKDIPVSSVDVITLIGVLQYLDDREVSLVLKNVRRILNKEGILLISTVTDRKIYTWFNLYRFILPNRYFTKEEIIKTLKAEGYRIDRYIERGIAFTPLFSHFFVIFFDILDKIIFRNRGTLGPLGKTIRKLVLPIAVFESKLPLNFGYTMYLKCSVQG